MGLAGTDVGLGRSGVNLRKNGSKLAWDLGGTGARLRRDWCGSLVGLGLDWNGKTARLWLAWGLTGRDGNTARL